MPPKATAIGEFELKVMKRVLLQGGGRADVSGGGALIGGEAIGGEDGARLLTALRKLEAAEYLEPDNGGLALTELGEEYLDMLGLLD